MNQWQGHGQPALINVHEECGPFWQSEWDQECSPLITYGHLGSPHHLRISKNSKFKTLLIFSHQVPVSVLDFKTIALQGQIPPAYPSVRVFCFVHPLKSTMIHPSASKCPEPNLLPRLLSQQYFQSLQLMYCTGLWPPHPAATQPQILLLKHQFALWRDGRNLNTATQVHYKGCFSSPQKLHHIPFYLSRARIPSQLSKHS